MKVIHAFCFASGEIDFGSEIPTGAFEIAQSFDETKLKEFIQVKARHGYKENVLLVPGIPEAENEEKAFLALAKWLRYIQPSASWKINITTIDTAPNGLPIDVVLSLEEMP